MVHRLLYVFALAGLLSACESIETYELAASSDSFIKLNLNGEEMLLNAVPAQTVNYYFMENNVGELFIEYTTPDNLHSLFLQIADCDLGPSVEAKSLTSEAKRDGCEQQVVIGYTTFEMNDDPLCPHLEGVPTEVAGTLTVEEWTEDGSIRGHFKSDAMGMGGYVMSGTFQTRL